MFRLRAAKNCVLDRIAGQSRGARADRGRVALRMAEVTAAIHLRELGGLSTTLRQLHKITEMSQPEALGLIRRLENAGIVRIEGNLADAFESTVFLTGEARRRMDRAAQTKAA